MFGQEGGHISQIADFAKIGLTAKTITLKADGRKKEDMKLRHIDFAEWTDPSIPFEDSEVYSFFNEHSFVFVIFQKSISHPDDPGKDIFLGFKRYTFSDDFIFGEVKATWDRVRYLVRNHKFHVTPCRDKNGQLIINPSGTIREETNFPKKSDNYRLFLRGGAATSDDKYKTESVNGFKIYPQFYWLDGQFLNEELSNIDYL